MIRNLIAQCWTEVKRIIARYWAKVKGIVAPYWTEVKRVIARYWAKALTLVSFTVMYLSGITWWFLMFTDVPEPRDYPGMAALTFGAMGLTGIFAVISIRKEEGGSIRSIIVKYFI